MRSSRGETDAGGSGNMTGGSDNMKRENRTRLPAPSAFTLIELLIVVAIIAILAAIAVPNFLEAQVRSKVARVKADMRSLGTALEAYAIDYNNVPDMAGVQWMGDLAILSTPVAYITTTSAPDPFWPNVESPYYPQAGSARVGWKPTFRYFPYNGWWANDYMHRTWQPKGAIMVSFGPALVETALEHYPYYCRFPEEWPGGGVQLYYGVVIPQLPDTLYDPTNGTRSRGGLGRTAGELPGPQVLGG
ncbi:MAG TPA: prepilin-type N-terminal cleavage/methylation domain-containing protein [Sumerlaeia bacterium]|nr:prepilin-type N-terminal cleavage/methylation domain-containing protein [Sumerlaeia bacterium]